MCSSRLRLRPGLGPTGGGGGVRSRDAGRVDRLSHRPRSPRSGGPDLNGVRRTDPPHLTRQLSEPDGGCRSRRRQCPECDSALLKYPSLRAWLKTPRYCASAVTTHQRLGALAWPPFRRVMKEEVKHRAVARVQILSLLVQEALRRLLAEEEGKLRPPRTSPR